MAGFANNIESEDGFRPRSRINPDSSLFLLVVLESS